MSASLAAFIATILHALLGYLVGDVEAYAAKIKAAKAAQASNQAVADASIKPLQNATTAKEEEDAADSALDGA